ncbi:MAG: hypothetical protein C6W58_01425 [Bacillaceae bacterium]|uniref:hypothetical protein n=1 Tax=Aeribacillus composti TaxID=1868734 RepID=UPI000E3AA171|nr:hypothetical protein [Aeribacillus composti]REJ20917.1 MAG: hypothetical protein C6W58_01425 [Bacillaceae bacterium]TVZ85837.1 hypothetical protein FB379_106120 [Aeribacillus composti]
MNIIFQDKVLKINENNLDELEKFMKHVNARLNENGLVFSHFLVNGTPFYSDIQDLINEYSNQEVPVEIVGITEREWMLELKHEGYQYIERAEQVLIQLSEKLYAGENTGDIWQQFVHLSEGLNYLYQIFSQSKLGENHENIVAGIRSVSEQLLQAMENLDFTLIADFIQYELLPLFAQMKEILKAEDDSNAN